MYRLRFVRICEGTGPAEPLFLVGVLLPSALAERLLGQRPPISWLFSKIIGVNVPDGKFWSSVLAVTSPAGPAPVVWLVFNCVEKGYGGYFNGSDL